MTDHLTSQELIDAVLRQPLEPNEHLQTCVRCQIRVARLRESESAAFEPTPRIRSALVAASPTIQPPTVSEGAPQVGEVWRTRGPQSVLLWIRRILDEETVDAVPMTLDGDMADEASLVLAPNETPWGLEAVLLLDYRTHVHIDALAAKVATLSTATIDVELLRNGQIEHLSGRIGMPISESHDQRLEYRELLRSGLSAFAPSVWTQNSPAQLDEPEIPQGELELRLPGIQFIAQAGHTVLIEPGVELAARSRCAYLDSVVLVCRLGAPTFTLNTEALLDACRRMIAEEHDADAIAVYCTGQNQDAIVARRADLRVAIGVPSGRPTSPVPYLRDMSLVDILFKHFDRYSFAVSWADASPMPDAATRDLASRAEAHARAAAESIASKGKAAQQEAKKAGYRLAAAQVETVEAFILDVTRGNVDAALAALKESSAND